MVFIDTSTQKNHLLKRKSCYHSTDMHVVRSTKFRWNHKQYLTHEFSLKVWECVKFIVLILILYYCLILSWKRDSSRLYASATRTTTGMKKKRNPIVSSELCPCWHCFVICAGQTLLIHPNRTVCITSNRFVFCIHRSILKSVIEPKTHRPIMSPPPPPPHQAIKQ